MPISPTSQITIHDPAFLQATMQAMVKLQKIDAFLIAYGRLLALFADHLAVETAMDRRRTASVWGNPCQEHEFRFWIREEPVALSSEIDPTALTSILAGVLHFDQSTQVWGIHT